MQIESEAKSSPVELQVFAYSKDSKAYGAAWDTATGSAFSNLRADESSHILMADCRGSDLSAYQVNVHYAADQLLAQCNCASRVSPCKHALALALKWGLEAQKFQAETAPEALRVALKPKSQKAKKATKAKKASVDGDAWAKKAQAQLQGLEQLERFVHTLVMCGLGQADLKEFQSRAAEMEQMHLPGAALALGALRQSLVHEDRHEAARLVSALAVAIRDGRQLFTTRQVDQSALPGVDFAEVESFLGRVFTIEDLRAMGMARQGASMVELAYTRRDDSVREERIEQSVLIDLKSGELFQEVMFVPNKLIKRHSGKVSYSGIIEVDECFINPGSATRRIRWASDSEKQTAATPQTFRQVIDFAKPMALALKEVRAALRSPLVSETFTLIAISELGTVDGKLAARGPDGAVIPLTRTKNETAVGGTPEGCAAMLCRHTLGQNGLIHEPMALITDKKLLRFAA